MIKTKLILLGVTVVLIGFMIGCDSSNISSASDSNVGSSNTDSEVSSDVGSSSEGTSLAQWYARTTVSAVIPDTQTIIAHKTAGVFGQLNESNDGKDLHDIIGMGTQSATLEVVFPQNEWDSASGDYFSDYHSIKEGDDSWTFQVKNMYNPNYPVDLSNEAIKITLEGIYTIKSIGINGNIRYTETLNRADERLEKLTLIDLDNRVAYAVSELPTAEITMDGMHTRTFKWVLGTVTEADYAAVTTPAVSKSMSFKNTVEAFKMSSETVPDSKFGLPPQ